MVCELHNLVLPSQMFMSGNTALDCPQGIFQTSHELDRYEKMWHNCIYQPSWNELKTEVRNYSACVPCVNVQKLFLLFQFAQYSQLWVNKLFIDIR